MPLLLPERIPEAMNKWRRWRFWRAVRDWCNRRMTDTWMDGGNCDSRCPRCKQWESHGNVITTEWGDHPTQERACRTCGYNWRAEFTPAGYVPTTTGEGRK